MSVAQYKKYIWFVDTIRANRRLSKEQIDRKWSNSRLNVDIMDAEDTIHLPVTDTKWIQYDIVGSHLANYDFMINLAHFKGHAMGGFGGVLKDMGILASTDPVALDKACLDLVFGHESVNGDDADPLIERIKSRHGTHIVEYAEQLGLGSTTYRLVNLDEQK